jgi:SAM-dependent methyltransferase
MPTVNLYQGNCLDELKKLPDNSIDAVVTDPPYGLGKEPDPVEVMKAWVEEKQHEVKGAGFMSKSWDAFVPQPAIWKEVYRVLKPGGHIVAFFGTRTYDWGVMAMRFAGFEIRDRIQWVFDNSEQRETFLASLTKEQRQELGGLLKGGDNEVFWVYGCYSDDTECFTSNGWKRYNQIDVTRDEILQWHQETNQFSWFKPDEVLVFEAPQEMVFFQNRHTSQLLTKNHNVYLKHRTNSRYAFKSDVVKAENVKKSWHKIFPLAARLENGQPNSFAYIIGWWLTDAWLHKDGKACMFSQSKPKTLNKLRSALESFDFKFSE